MIGSPAANVHDVLTSADMGRAGRSNGRPEAGRALVPQRFRSSAGLDASMLRRDGAVDATRLHRRVLGLLLVGPHLEQSSAVCGPKLCSSGTSVASRPRAMTTRPMRGMLWRGVERVPFAVEEDLEPGGEIHRRRIGRHADVAEIAVHVARRNVHAAAERDGQMREVAADADPLLMRLRRGAGRARIAVAEGQAVVDIVDRSPARAPSPAADGRTGRQARPPRWSVSQ